MFRLSFSFSVRYFSFPLSLSPFHSSLSLYRIFSSHGFLPPSNLLLSLLSPSLSSSLPSVLPAVFLPVSLWLFLSPGGFLQPLIQADGEWQAKRTSLWCRMQGTSHTDSLTLSLSVIHSNIDVVTHSNLHFLSPSHDHVALTMCVYVCVLAVWGCHRHTGGTELIVSQGDTSLTAV